MDRFCSDFSDIMFTKDFTKRAYLGVIQGFKKRHGRWESEVYRGEDKGAIHLAGEIRTRKGEISTGLQQ